MKHLDQSVRGRNIFDINLNHEYLFFRRTKVIATIGPSSSSPEIMKKMILSGLNVARINFSHGNAQDHLRTIRTIRKISEKMHKSVAILGDLCGPKIRVGRFKNDSVFLKDNSTVTITTETVLGDETVIPCLYKNLISEISVNDSVLLDDGNLELKVIKKEGKRLKAKVIRGGILKNNKGMNLPDTKMNIPALTAKDKKDVEYCIRGQVDYIALSFVRRPEDIMDLKNLLRRKKADIPVIAKIEKPEALQNILEILKVADGIMIARGDLGVELPAKKVPFIQGKLIETCIQHSKPVIVATQMLESMIEHSRPTRAEVTDVAAACLSGADAVMLSGETASGKYPVEAIQMMDSILREAEAYQFFTHGGFFRDNALKAGDITQNALSSAIAQLARDLMVRCIIVVTRTGFTAAVVSSDRPAAPVIALTPSEKVLRKLQMRWGVFPYLVDGRFDINNGLAFAETFMKRLKLAGSGDFILMVSYTGGKKTETSLITVHKIS